jgi:hypothetical protein
MLPLKRCTGKCLIKMTGINELPYSPRVQDMSVHGIKDQKFYSSGRMKKV